MDDSKRCARCETADEKSGDGAPDVSTGSTGCARIVRLDGSKDE
jgi:hypothetical protein